MIEIDPDGALRLAAAIARQWIRDEPQALPTVAAWLGIEADVLRRRLYPPAARRAPEGWPTCPACGAPLPEHNNGTRGRKRLWCSDRCRQRASNMR